MVKAKIESESKTEQKDQVESDYAKFYDGISEELELLVMEAFEHFGYNLRYIRKNSDKITMITHSHDRVVYALDGEELFAVHSKQSIKTDKDNFGFVGTLEYNIIFIKED